MDNLEESQLGVIVSDITDVDLPCHSIWSFLHPCHERYKNLTAFVSTKTGESYTYKELTQSSLRFAKELEKYVEYNSSEPVAIIMPNNIDYPIVELGIFAVGAAVCLIRHDFKPDIALGILKDVNPKVLVIDSTVIENLKEIFGQLPKDLKIFVRGPNKNLPEGEDLHKILYSTEEGLDVEKAIKVDPESIAVVTCSSGTTGKPKAILLTHRNTVNGINCIIQKELFPVKRAEDGDQDKLLAHLPFAHTFSLNYYTIAATSVGCQIFDLDTEDLSIFIEVVNKYKPRVLTFRAYMVDSLTKMPQEIVKEKMKSAEVIINVGCPLNPASVQQLKATLGNHILFADGFGTSESGPSISNTSKYWRLGSTGKLLPNIKARVVDMNTGKPILKPFIKGELQLITPGIMKGYLNNPEATKEAFDGEWYRTGDVCYFDDDRFFYVIERYKDLITFRGKKVFPTSIENVIIQHDAVLDVGVVAVPDSKSKEEVAKAFIVRRGSVTEEEIIEFVKRNAPHEDLWLYGGVKFVETLPRNHLGKMLRKVLREMDWTET